MMSFSIWITSEQGLQMNLYRNFVRISVIVSLGEEQGSNENEAIHGGRRNGYLCLQKKSGIRFPENVHTYY